MDNTSISNMVVSKRVRSNNTSGYTGVWYNSRQNMWESYISFKKKKYHLELFKDKEDAYRARRAAEAVLHDPVIFANWDSLTEERKKDIESFA